MNMDFFDKIKSLFHFLFDDYNFQILQDAYESTDFGNAMIVAQSNNLCIRFIRDRGQIYVELGSLSAPGNWYELSKVLAILEEEKHINHKYRNEALSQENAALALEGNIANILEHFRIDKFKKTEIKLKHLEELQLKEMLERFQHGKGKGVSP